MGGIRLRRWLAIVVALGLALSTGCATSKREKTRYGFEPDEFRAELRARVPDIPESLSSAPFVVDPEIVERAREYVSNTPRGPERVQALVDFLSKAKPEGLGLVYDWTVTAGANRTIELGRGNCVALASVLVGLGRGLGWPVYYVEARTRHPETKEFETVRTVSDHMAVLIAAKSVQLVVDFTGLVDVVERLRPVNDVTAYAHIMNNIAAGSVLASDGRTSKEGWERAVRGFELATRIDPELGRSWNNLGIALSRVGRVDDARRAYERAVELDTAFGSARRNLIVMETRLLGDQILMAPSTPDAKP